MTILQILNISSGKVQVEQDVFYIPRQSHFIFVNQLEQPADDELEFSDDEVEAAYCSCLKHNGILCTFGAFFETINTHTVPSA
ncbi:hypothetical protein P691DRAFT_768428 [Macrolepiota fuliginosa MF-IS2]|uniref:Uncharacterized protein n=1 Tax=Macrolepiota fuliginosa MF-IS2 TaxID=1400762 RepID=A0A9P6BW35_9AGAR|nr:hypothetical protein P691DRAFT_768428 [Macrolepiota fuliginosa MF-IS2]